ncbi:MAG: hypothetical protein AAF721_31060 [Myxococcota bacterium]
MLAAVLGVLAFAAPPPQGNSVLTRKKGPIYSVGAAVRLGVLVGDGKRVMQPVGFGAGITFRVHALHLGPLRLGGMLKLGHTRFLQRATLLSDTSAQPVEVRRFSALGHTDFALGPSLQLVLGRVMIEGGVGPGLGISTLVRSLGPTVSDEEEVTDVTLLVRGGGQLAIPIRNNQGILIGAAVQRYFSRKQVVADADLDDPAALPNANPFDLVLDTFVGYQMWF